MSNRSSFKSSSKSASLPSSRTVSQPVEEEEIGSDAIFMSVKNLELLKYKFNIDEFGNSKGLPYNEFIIACYDVFKEKDLSLNEISHLFMKIDANSDGTVDWNEFTNYLLMENQGHDKMMDDLMGPSGSEFKEHPQSHIPENIIHYHKGMIDRILNLPAYDKYVTISRDGTFSTWQAGTGIFQNNISSIGKRANTYYQTPNQPSKNILKSGQSSWLVDATYMPLSNKIAICSLDRNIIFYDTFNFEVSCRIHDSKLMENVPLCMHAEVYNDKEIITIGDDGGNVTLIDVEQNWHICDGNISSCKHPEPKRNGITLHKLNGLHKDWVTKARFIPALSQLVTCSMDSTINLCDPEKMNSYERFHHSFHTFRGHQKPVYSFDWSHNQSFMVSCGLERKLLVWDPYSCVSINSLVGHSASVQDVIINADANQIISLSVDKVIKVWDCRTFRCIQTLVDTENHRPENRFTALSFDKKNNCLLAASNRLHFWNIKTVAKKDDSSHNSPLCSALFNSSFGMVVSADESGTIIVWHIDNGGQAFRFSDSGKLASKITSMCFDDGGRRLIVGYHNGYVKDWNFNSGECFTTFAPSKSDNDVDSERKEVTAVYYLQEKKSENQDKYIISVGWSRNVSVYPVNKENPVQSPRKFNALPKMTFEEEETNLTARSMPKIKEKVEVKKKFQPLSVRSDSTKKVESSNKSKNHTLIESHDDSNVEKVGHSNDILCVTVCFNSIIATGGADGAIVLSNFDNGNIRKKLKVSDSSVVKLEWAEKLEILISISEDGFIRLWEVVKGKLLYSVYACHSNAASIGSLKLSLNNNLLFTGDSIGAIKVWNFSLTRDILNKLLYNSNQSNYDPIAVETCKWLTPLLFFHAHDSAISNIDFVCTEKYKFILTSSEDCSVRLWTLEGCLVGIFGQITSWKLGDLSTYRETVPDPKRILPKEGFCKINNESALNTSKDSFSLHDENDDVAEYEPEETTNNKNIENEDIDVLLERLGISNKDKIAPSLSTAPKNLGPSAVLNKITSLPTGRRIWTLTTKPIQDVPR